MYPCSDTAHYNISHTVSIRIFILCRSFFFVVSWHYRITSTVSQSFIDSLNQFNNKKEYTRAEQPLRSFLEVQPCLTTQQLPQLPDTPVLPPTWESKPNLTFEIKNLNFSSASWVIRPPPGDWPGALQRQAQTECQACHRTRGGG